MGSVGGFVLITITKTFKLPVQLVPHTEKWLLLVPSTGGQGGLGDSVQIFKLTCSPLVWMFEGEG